MSIIINNIAPVFILIGLGRLLYRWEIAPKSFFAAADRLVYFILFPILLFWKIGESGSIQGRDWLLVSGVLAVILATWAAALLYVKLSGLDRYRAGSFAQLSFRFNTFVGMAVVLSAFGESGVRDFGLMISLAIPAINVLSVLTLIWFGQGEPQQGRIRLLLKAVIGNPLIIACLAGLAYNGAAGSFPVFFRNTFNLAASAALPLALLSIGSSLSFREARSGVAPALAAAGLKLVFMPAVGYAVLSALGVGGQPLQVALLYFTLPTATSSYILSGQLGSDVNLASTGIVIGTLLSFFSMSAALLI